MNDINEQRDRLLSQARQGHRGGTNPRAAQIITAAQNARTVRGISMFSRTPNQRIGTGRFANSNG